MDPSKAIATADKAIGYLSELNDFIQEAKDRGINSLSAYTKQTLISSRVYIEDAIAGEKIVIDILNLVNQMYAGMVLTALNLNTIISEGHTVRTMTAPVSTETFDNVVNMIKDQFGDKNVDVRAVEAKEEKQKVLGSINGKDISVDVDPAKLFTGRLMAVTLGVGQNKVEIYFLVQLCPYILPGLVMEQFITNHTDPSKELRKAQWKAGEIKFWRDYIFECDRVEKRKKALRLDKDGILHEIEEYHSNAQRRAVKNLAAAKGAVNRNIANTIILVSKQKLDKVCREFGLNMKNFKDRQNIMANTLSLMMVVYDPNYETVDLYMNGIASRGEYTAQMISSAAKKKDDIDMKQLLTIIAAGNTPKF